MMRNTKGLLLLMLFATTRTSIGRRVFYDRTPLGDSIDGATMKILKESYESAGDKNVIASPLGVLTLLSMLAAGTEGESRDEIMQLLNGTDYKQIESSYSSLTEKYTSMDPSYFVLANKVYVSDDFTLVEQFSSVARQSYKSEVEQVDFKQQQAAADTINAWAKEKTKGHISSPVDADMIRKDTAVALFNVIFFKGNWGIKFEVSNTEDKDFYVDETTTVKKPMMKLLAPLLYHEDRKLGAKMIELPYKEEGFRMVVILPNEKDGLQEVMNKLAERGLLENVFQLRPITTKIDLELPKFEINNKLDLNDILPKVGVSRIFTEGTSGVVRERAVKVSKAFQQAFVKVDEEGATAGAFTGILLVPVSSDFVPPPPIQFKVDHPFLFVILHEDIILFTGTYTH